MVTKLCGTIQTPVLSQRCFPAWILLGKQLLCCIKGVITSCQRLGCVFFCFTKLLFRLRILTRIGEIISNQPPQKSMGRQLQLFLTYQLLQINQSIQQVCESVSKQLLSFVQELAFISRSGPCLFSHSFPQLCLPHTLHSLHNGLLEV